ncbi:hypothetical protein AeMF1_014255 [Aphanomyces euteiches]|nr:hypothetical protein AeMF1_014255 [Aphanomyces euteiches]
MYEEMINGVSGSLSCIGKDKALKIASSAWAVKMKPSNMISGFKTSGIWPLNYDRMVDTFKLFHDGGVPSSYLEAESIKRRDEIRQDIQCLPTATKKRAPAKPKTIDVAGRVLTMSLLQEIDVTKQQRALAREEAKELRSTREKKRKRKPQPPTKSSIQAPESTTETAKHETTQVFVI